MAVGNLPASGVISFGDGNGEEKSLNAFQNIKRAQGIYSRNTVRDFCLWGYNYVKNPGDPLNRLDGSAPFSFNETRGLIMISFRVSLANETPSKYQTNNNCALEVMPLQPTTGGTFDITCDGFGTQTVNVNNTAVFNSGRASIWDQGDDRDLTITYNGGTGGGSATCSLVVVPTYNFNGSQCTGTATAGGAGVTYNAPGNPNFGIFYYFYSGPRDPSGRPQGYQ